MSVVLERVNKNKADIKEKALAGLTEKGLSVILRRETWSDHERARFSPFEESLAYGTISEEAYKDFMVQTYAIYIALEERAAELKDDPIAGKVIFPELNRKSAIEADLEFFFGTDWRHELKTLPITDEYVDRIRKSSPLQFIAHHYTRYLADLSGGVFIYNALKKAWDRGDDGLRYYLFPEVDAHPFKKQYRGILDELPLSDDQKWEVIEESLVAYEYNVEVTNELAERYQVVAASH